MPHITNVGVSEDAKEKARWEMFPSKLTILNDLQPGNPYRKGNEYGKPGAEYPKMLKMAKRAPGTGKLVVASPQPPAWEFRDGAEWDRACQGIAAFNASCLKTVNSEDEELKARGQGWRETAEEALALAQAEHDKLGNEAAERHYKDAKMSDKAQAEVRKVESEHADHLGEIPPKPVKRKYVRKTQPAA